jgi:hypothetical protein
MSNNNNEWTWDPDWNLYRRYLLDEGNWLYSDGRVVDFNGNTVRVEDMTAIT